MNAREFLDNLKTEISSHYGVNHPLLSQVSEGSLTREDYKAFGLQHYPLVGNFTSYLELLLLRAPTSDTKQWLAKVLVDEYGEGSEGKDHATLYREFLTSCGVEEGEEFETLVHEDVTAFIKEHLRICTEEPFLVGLGAVGPGHEWSIPKMFSSIVKGLRQADFQEQEILYFALHMEQDVDHGLWLEEALLKFCDDKEAQEQVHRGTLLSLEARARFWSGVQSKVNGPNNDHAKGEMPWGMLKKRIAEAKTFKAVL